MFQLDTTKKYLLLCLKRGAMREHLTLTARFSPKHSPSTFNSYLNKYQISRFISTINKIKNIISLYQVQKLIFTNNVILKYIIAL